MSAAANTNTTSNRGSHKKNVIASKFSHSKKNNSHRSKKPSGDAKARAKLRKRLIIAGSSLLFLVLVLYVSIAVYTQDRFSVGTSIQGTNVAFKTVDEVQKDIGEIVANYSLDIDSRSRTKSTIFAQEVDLRYDRTDELQAILDRQESWQWPARLFNNNSEGEQISVEFDSTALSQKVNQFDFMNADTMLPPINAYSIFKNGSYEIVPEQLGTTINSVRTLSLIEFAIRSGSSSLNLDEQEAYLEPAIKSNNPTLLGNIEKYSKYVRFSVVYNIGNNVEIVNGDVSINWVEYLDDGRWDLSIDAITAWLNGLAAKYNTLGTERVYTRPDGKVVEVAGGTFGWAIDVGAEASALYHAWLDEVSETREPIWQKTAKTFGKADWGNTFVDVDLAEQHLRYYVDNALAYECDIVSGQTPGFRTPAGTFDIFTKQTPARLRGPAAGYGFEWDVEVQYWMQITQDGVGLHDATWQPNFGGTRYLTAGSHGCINLSLKDARALYEMLDMWSVVIVHY